MSKSPDPDGSSEPIVCPICLTSKVSETFYWVISPPFISLLLGGSKRLYVELSCCPNCFANIKRRRFLVRSLAILLPIGVAVAFWVKFQWFPHLNEAKFTIAVAATAFAIVVVAFARTGLDRVHVSDERIIQQGKRLSAEVLRNSTPWFLPSLSHYRAQKVELPNDAPDDE